VGVMLDPSRVKGWIIVKDIMSLSVRLRSGSFASDEEVTGGRTTIYEIKYGSS
jgi:hypothetical protein